MFGKADRDRIVPALDRIEREVSKTASNQWAVAFAKQLEHLEAGLDKLMQSQAALKADLDAQKQYLCDSFLAIRALLTALDLKKSPVAAVNGKRKRKAA